MKIIVVPAIIVVLFLCWFISSVTADSACGNLQEPTKKCAEQRSVLLPYVSVPQEQTSQSPTAVPTGAPTSEAAKPTPTVNTPTPLSSTPNPVTATAPPPLGTPAPTTVAGATATPTIEATAEPATATTTSPPSAPTSTNVSNDVPNATATATSEATVEPNQPPTVSLIAPSSGQSFVASELISVEISATDPDGLIERVELFVDDNSFGINRSAPYRWDLSSLATGPHALRMVAIDNEGKTTEAALTITVREESIPALLSDPPIVSELKQIGNALSISWTGCEAATSTRVLYGKESTRPSELITMVQTLTTPNLATTGSYQVLVECYDELGNSIFGEPEFVNFIAVGS